MGQTLVTSPIQRSGRFNKKTIKRNRLEGVVFLFVVFCCRKA